MTTADLLRRSIELLPANEDQLDRFVNAAYDDLFAAAPAVRELFSPDIADPAAHPGSPGRLQRDRFLRQIVDLGTQYDPADPERMAELNRGLMHAGATHAWFAATRNRPAGGAKFTEYHVVWSVFIRRLRITIGESWDDRFGYAWEEAYDHAVRHMMAAQKQWLDEHPDPSGRMPRSIGSATVPAG